MYFKFEKAKEMPHSQFQQGQVGVAVEVTLFALLHHVVLEDRGGLGVVPIEATENGVDMARSGFTLVEGDHLVGFVKRGLKRAGLEVFLFGGIFDCGPGCRRKIQEW